MIEHIDRSKHNLYLEGFLKCVVLTRVLYIFNYLSLKLKYNIKKYFQKIYNIKNNEMWSLQLSSRGMKCSCWWEAHLFGWRHHIIYKIFFMSLYERCNSLEGKNLYIFLIVNHFAKKFDFRNYYQYISITP